MKKLIALAVFGLGAAAGAGYLTQPVEFAQFVDPAVRVLEKAWAGIESNPTPVLAALGTFLLTIVYHKARGKSLRESVEVAATRVQVVAVQAPAPEVANPVVQRAQARATRTQLVADQITLENSLRALPSAVKQAERDACYTENAVAETEKLLAQRKQAHTDAVAKLEGLREELSKGRAELSAIASELKRLAEVV